MPSISMFKRRGKKSRSGKVLDDNDRSSPPGVAPIDPDGSTASHSSNENYLSSHARQSPIMTASQFQHASDAEMDRKRAQADSLNVRSKQGKDCQTKSRDGVPIITAAGADHFSPSAVSSSGNYATEGFYSKSKKMWKGKDRPKVRPSAKQSAFMGAPRYDWMDIETTAAIKLQAAYRRVQTQDRLDREGLSTPGMRNRRAMRQARQQARMSRHTVSQDVPFPFNLCGVGLLFGDATMEDEKIVDSLEKKKARELKAQYEREDAEKRRFRMKKKESQHMEEGIEVVESFEGEEEEEPEGGEVVGGEPMEESESKGGSRKSFRNSPRRSAKGLRSKSKKLSKSQNDFDPTEDQSL